MKRHGGLWPLVTGWPNLEEAARRAALGKRSRPDVAAFLLERETHLAALRRELLEGRYQPAGYRTFVIHEPKPRQISAAPFRDRVVHHALTQVLEPIFERRFSGASYACRVGKGTHAALAAARGAARSYPYVLKCDVRKYFASIDHAILVAELQRVIRCGQTVELARRIVEGSNEQETVAWYFPGDSLFTPAERRRGLPLGNQTSQFFANVYLNRFDHFVQREIRPGAYLRYVDDFLLFASTQNELKDAHGRIGEFLGDFRLRLHEGKSRIYRVRDGVTFLGWRIFPDRMRLVRQNVVRFRRRLAERLAGYAAGTTTREEVEQSVRAWIGHAQQGDTWRLREQIFADNPLVGPPRLVISSENFRAAAPPVKPSRASAFDVKGKGKRIKGT